ncbi:unnamed protein product [Discula destructiva]
MSSRNLAALAAAVVAGIAGGFYTFGPILKEQQMAQDHWKNPGNPKTDPTPQDRSVKAQDQTEGSSVPRKGS